MKKLAIITTHPIQYQIPLFKKLQQKKIETHVFFASKHGISVKYRDPEFLIKLRWDINSKLLKGYKYYFPKNEKYKIDDFRLSFPNIEKILKEKKFNAILILGWNNLHYLRAINFGLRNKIKLILRAENNLRENNNLFKKILKYFLFRIFFKSFNYILSIGLLNKNFYLYYGVDEKKILNAPYFVDNNFFNIKSNKNVLKKKLKIHKKKIVLFVGKLIKRKRPFDFLQLVKINQNNDKYRFIMIGDGNLKKNCEIFIKKNNLKNLLLLGFVNQSKLREFYNISDLVILPSDYETWGLTINEAFASRTPVICTQNCGASHDLIINKKTGYTYKAGDIKELKKKTDLILNNKKLSYQMRKNIKNKIKSYSVINTLTSILQILNEK